MLDENFRPQNFFQQSLQRYCSLCLRGVHDNDWDNHVKHNHVKGLVVNKNEGYTYYKQRPQKVMPTVLKRYVSSSTANNPEDNNHGTSQLFRENM